MKFNKKTIAVLTMPLVLATGVILKNYRGNDENEEIIKDIEICQNSVSNEDKIVFENCLDVIEYDYNKHMKSTNIEFAKNSKERVNGYYNYIKKRCIKECGLSDNFQFLSPNHGIDNKKYYPINDHNIVNWVHNEDGSNTPVYDNPLQKFLNRSINWNVDDKCNEPEIIIEREKKLVMQLINLEDYELKLQDGKISCKDKKVKENNVEITKPVDVVKTKTLK